MLAATLKEGDLLEIWHPINHLLVPLEIGATIKQVATYKTIPTSKAILLYQKGASSS